MAAQGMNRARRRAGSMECHARLRFCITLPLEIQRVPRPACFPFHDPIRSPINDGFGAGHGIVSVILYVRFCL